MTTPLFQTPWIYLVGAAYAIPALRLVLSWFHDDWSLLRSVNPLAGRLELFLGWARDCLLIPWCGYLLYRRVAGWVTLGEALAWPLEIPCIALSLYARRWRWHGLAVLQEFARLNPRVHPSEFFRHLYARLGFLPHRVPVKPLRRIDPNHLNFKSGKKSRQSLWILLHGVYDTFIFATLAYKAFKWKGAHYIRTAGSGLSLVWASRLAQLGRMEVRVERSPEAGGIREGKKIYAVNHKSFFDFCLAPLAYLKENPDGSAASFIPSIMVAKDHFKDNLFLYKIVGFGKMLEAWGMVFVDRKSKRPGKAREAVGDAVKKLIASDLPFSIYPQGTRARGQLDRSGQRWDAGYFCVGREGRLKQEGGHFKKGVAYVAVDTALSLLKHQLAGPVWVIPVAMIGIGTAAPKGALKVQTETEVKIRVGHPVCIRLSEMEALKGVVLRDQPHHPLYKETVERIAGEIDTSLQQLLDVSRRLERRLFVDLNDLLGSQGIDEVSIAMKQWRGEGPLIYSILDCIYALPMKHWRGYLSEVAHLMRRDCTRHDLVALRNRIARHF